MYLTMKRDTPNGTYVIDVCLCQFEGTTITHLKERAPPYAERYFHVLTKAVGMSE